jgi:hypothetical protein
MDTNERIDMIDTTGLRPDQVRVLEYVTDMLRNGMQPRIINVTPEQVAERVAYRIEVTEDGDEDREVSAEFSRLVSDRAAQWVVARQADEEIENNHHFLDGVMEDLHDAVETVLDTFDE